MIQLRCVLVLLVMLLAACGGKQNHGAVENPYLEKAHAFSADGMAAMRRERWNAAERGFSRALLAAQLADNAVLVRLSWYNLGVVRSAMQHAEEAEDAFRRCITLSRRQGDDAMRIRAGLALALMQMRLEREVDQVDVRGSGLPADIYLQSGRLAQLQGRADAADKAYHSAIAKSRRSANGLRIRADAHMGLALLQQQSGDAGGARKSVDKALAICREIGAPRLTAHALFLSAGLSQSAMEQKDQYERALTIYTALDDMRGQRETLERLQSLAEDEGDSHALERIRLRLHGLGGDKQLSIDGDGP